ncbi:hypothetical protein POTOM_022681 [Populus tomentosa]|uniref:Uncharacterized protein n=1 Tax=Populus tomentosa TaxID=118781 RepID=A0A8X7ZNZ4_POPTO|nr:hypothetical protein POTOM_022681 [Populus tomentosa]
MDFTKKPCMILQVLSFCNSSRESLICNLIVSQLSAIYSQNGKLMKYRNSYRQLVAWHAATTVSPQHILIGSGQFCLMAAALFTRSVSRTHKSKDDIKLSSQ